MPIEPDSTAASSVRMSPKVFSATITSKRLGVRTSCIAAVSTSTWSSSMSGYSSPISIAISRHSREDSSTLALSTDVSFFRRIRASSKPTRSTRVMNSSL